MVTVEKRFEKEYTLEQGEEFDQDGLEQLFLDLKYLLSAASTAGFLNPFLRFSGVTGSDGWPAYISVDTFGQCPMTEEEKEEERQSLLVQSLSEKLGVSYHEASVVYRLEKDKKIKLA
jgi:hypothetical protein